MRERTNDIPNHIKTAKLIHMNFLHRRYLVFKIPRRFSVSNEDQSVLFCYLKRSQARKNNNVGSTKERGSLRLHHHIPLAPSKPKITYLGKVRTRVARRNEEREMANIVNCSHKIWKELMSEIPNHQPIDVLTRTSSSIN